MTILSLPLDCARGCWIGVGSMLADGVISLDDARIDAMGTEIEWELFPSEAITTPLP